MMRFDRLNTMTDDRNPEPFTLRSAVPDDQAFLYELYRSTRREEMSAWGWDSAQERMFLELQFTAQRRHYDIAFPGADHKIILSGNRPIGLIVVFRTAREIRLVNVALLPEHRGSGIGALLIRGLCEEAKQAGKPVTLHVDRLNRAARLYQRLGFSITGDTGTDYEMEWRPDESSSDRRLEL
jgi:ribosomal protein S18 acetylase RimI-like enzyme